MKNKIAGTFFMAAIYESVIKYGKGNLPVVSATIDHSFSS
jgi:hypothetical protein